MASVACIGECMVELRQAQGGQSAGHSSGQGGGLYSRGFGGDTLNTAVYLARLEVKVDYLTVFGDDALSDEMIAAWTAEGVREAEEQVREDDEDLDLDAGDRLVAGVARVLRRELLRAGPTHQPAPKARQKRRRHGQ